MLFLLTLQGCGTQQTLAPFPNPPEELMVPPQDISTLQLKDNPTLSNIAEQHVIESTAAIKNQIQVEDLQKWITEQKANYDRAAKKM